MKRSYRYETTSRFVSPPGSAYNKEYKTVMVDGAEEIECVGDIPLDQLIQADADSCRIASIVKRFTAGDAAALNARASSYLDLTAAPHDLLEAQAQLQKAQTYFASLSPEIQKEYNFDFQKFLSASADGSFVTKFGEATGILKPTTKTDPVPSEVI